MAWSNLFVGLREDLQAGRTVPAGHSDHRRDLGERDALRAIVSVHAFDPHRRLVQATR